LRSQLRALLHSPRDGHSRNRPYWSIIIRASVDHRAAVQVIQTRSSSTAESKVAAALVLLIAIWEKRSDYLRSPAHLSTARTLQVAKPNRLTEVRVLPLELQIGDRISDEAGEWEVIGRPFTTAAG
jgi:hypothetical protein